MLLPTGATSSITCPTQILSKHHWSNAAKSHHSHSQILSLSTPLWKVMIISGKGNGNGWKCQAISTMGVLAAAVVLSTPPPSEETLSNIPQTLGQSCEPNIDSQECEGMMAKKRIQKPKSRNAESCTSKCVTTCTRGGEGSPGNGPLTVRGPKLWCLSKVSEVANIAWWNVQIFAT